jgi:hypothetical protein
MMWLAGQRGIDHGQERRGVQTGSGPSQRPVQWSPFLEKKRSGIEAYNSLPSSDEFEKYVQFYITSFLMERPLITEAVYLYFLHHVLRPQIWLRAALILLAPARDVWSDAKLCKIVQYQTSTAP